MSIRRNAIALSGGLDLTTPAPLTRAGTLADCLNYEVASRRGYTRIDGFERFDGRPGVAEHRVLQVAVTDAVGSFALRNRVFFSPDAPALPHQQIDGYITSIEPAAGGLTLGIVFAGGMPDPSLPDQLQSASGTTATATDFTSLDQPLGLQADFDFALKQLAIARRAQVGEVPGRPGSDVLGGFLLRNTVYAVRDLPRAFFEGGYYTDADEGLFVQIGANRHRILEARVLGDLSGFVAYDPVPGTGTLATGIGTPTLTSLPVTGSLDGGFVGVPYSDGLVVSGGTPPYFWSLAESDAGPPAAAEITDLSEIDFQSEVTPAALWRATPTGWQRVPLGREVAFASGAAGLSRRREPSTPTPPTSAIPAGCSRPCRRSTASTPRTSTPTTARPPR